ncbi:hypothetical protein F503_03081 [Ophiostoma piceae UAMH 11346]|uniref:Protein kinase domain-containing protein n=1 Tax=Ophiostoma piceae (strain UAMH 11346) TaxID=1262450 RepID=S3BZG0_OPHP1|nr:hypothetical protein F503_03081 [Ophiostoma piceae UAMH 11346]
MSPFDHQVFIPSVTILNYTMSQAPSSDKPADDASTTDDASDGVCADYFDEDDILYPRPIQFQLGRSTIHATADLMHPFYRHVLKLDLHRRAWQRFVARCLLPCLPAVCQRLVQRWWPSCSLPDCVVLKKLAQPDHTHAFENEQAMYRRLAAFQGRLIPYFYGEAQCEGARALLVSFVQGVTVRDQPKPRLSVDDLIERIRVVAEDMATSGIVYSDEKLDNIILTDDGRIVFIDLEMAEEEPDPAECVYYLLKRFEYLYTQFLKVVDDEDCWY